VRDRRWDFLYERQKQPVKDFVLERFAEELARELSAWPPPFVDWVSEELRRRYAAGLADPPREEVLRLALEVARLDLLRQFEAIDRLMDREAPRRWRTAAEAAAGHLIARFVAEKCLALKEQAAEARLSRAELAEALRAAERRICRSAG
jgi:uncharacterized protein (DUF2236 family)